MTTDAVSTVMGPGPSVAPNKMFDPPKLTPTTDKLIWRKKVRLWAKTVKSLARSGDSKAVSAYNAMPYTLYQSIDDTYGGKLEGAIDAGTLSIDPEENGDVDPVTTIERIIQVVAKDSITDTVRREVSMLNAIHGCKRKPGETTTAFAHRYEGLALRYMNNCDALGARQISQSFALILLDNSNVTSSVYSAVVSQIVSKANEKRLEDEELFIMTKGIADKIEDNLKQLTEQYRAFKVDNNIQRPDEDDSMMQLMMLTKNDMSRMIKKHARKDSDDRPDARITLEDAIQAISDVKIDETKDKSQYMSTHRTMLGKRMSGTRGYSDTNGYSKPEYDKRTKPNHTNFDISKQGCRMCKQKGHFYRDPACIFNQIRGILDKQGDTTVDADGKDDQITILVSQLKTTAGGKEVHPGKKVRFPDSNATQKKSFFQ